jgi:hypothetical protein
MVEDISDVEIKGFIHDDLGELSLVIVVIIDYLFECVFKYDVPSSLFLCRDLLVIMDALIRLFFL